jgi:hypothetical protein
MSPPTAPADGPVEKGFEEPSIADIEKDAADEPIDISSGFDACRGTEPWALTVSDWLRVKINARRNMAPTTDSCLWLAQRLANLFIDHFVIIFL